MATRDVIRPVRAVAVRAPERDTGVASLDCRAVRAVVAGFAVRAVTVAPVVRVAVFARVTTFAAVVERAATFFVALRGSVVAGVDAVRALVVPERVVVLDDFWDCVIVFAPRKGVAVDTFVAPERDAARTTSS